MNTLITAEALMALQRAGTPPVLLDCGFDLADPGAGARAHAAGHLPGAHYAHVEDDLSGATRGPDGSFRGRHPLPSRDAFAACVMNWGIGPDTMVVAYDAQGGPYAARAWWLLRWLGHERVAVLDGGVQAWQAAGGELTGESASATAAAPYLHRPPAMLTIEIPALLAQLGRLRLLDARAAERFRGDVEPIDPVAGHIPGARQRFFKDNIAPDGRFKSPEALHADFAPLVAGHAPEAVVHHCGSGVTACHNVLAMAHAGLGLSALYPGSWSEWCSRPDLPVARGA